MNAVGIVEAWLGGTHAQRRELGIRQYPPVNKAGTTLRKDDVATLGTRLAV